MADSIDPGPFFNPLDDGLHGPGGPGRDNRPTYNPDALVNDVVALLGTIGIAARVASPYVAGLAAADLLRALGVRPVTVHDASKRADG